MKRLTLTNNNGTQFTFTKTDSVIVNIQVNKDGNVANYFTSKEYSVSNGTIAAQRENGTNVEMPIDDAQALNDFLKSRTLVKLETLNEVRAAESNPDFGKTFANNEGVMCAYKYSK